MHIPMDSQSSSSTMERNDASLMAVLSTMSTVKGRLEDVVSDNYGRFIISLNDEQNTMRVTYKLQLVHPPEEADCWCDSSIINWVAIASSDMTYAEISQRVSFQGKLIPNFIKQAVYLCVRAGLLLEPSKRNEQYNYRNMKNWKKYPQFCVEARLSAAERNKLEAKIAGMMKDGVFVKKPKYLKTGIMESADILVYGKINFHSTGHHLSKYEDNSQDPIYKYFSRETDITNEEIRKVVNSVLHYPHPSATLLPLIKAHDRSHSNYYKDYNYHQFPADQRFIGVADRGPTVNDFYTVDCELKDLTEKEKKEVSGFKQAVLPLELSNEVLAQKSTIGKNFEEFVDHHTILKGIIVNKLEALMPSDAYNDLFRWVELGAKVLKYPWDHGDETRMISARANDILDLSACHYCLPYIAIYATHLNIGKPWKKYENILNRNLSGFYEAVKKTNKEIEPRQALKRKRQDSQNSDVPDKKIDRKSTDDLR